MRIVILSERSESKDLIPFAKILRLRANALRSG